MFVGAVKPVRAKIGPAGHPGVSGPQLVDVGHTKLLLHFVFTLKGRVANDGIYFRPGALVAIRSEQGIGTDNVLV